MDYKKTASDILANIGGESNVSHLEHCSTRLRFTLIDSSKVKMDQLKATPGVMGVVMAAQCQVIIGNSVIEVFDAINKIANFNNSGEAPAPSGEKKKFGAIFMDYLISIFQPLIPAIAGAGILKAMLSVFTMFGWMDSTGTTYRILYQASDAALYFLPLMVAVTCATKLKVNKLVALAAVGALIIPSMTSIIAQEGGAVLFGFTLQNIQYTYQVFPAILSVFFLALVEKLVTKISPKPIRVFFVPMICFVVVVPVTLIVLGPLGFTFGTILTKIILTLYEYLGWIAVALLAAILPFMISTGMHKALVPYAVSSITEMGRELLYMPASLAHNISESGACFAVAVKTKDVNLRSTAISAAISALFGITEPALYGVTLQKKRALGGVIAGSFIGGLVVGIFGVRAFVAMGPGLAGMAMFVDPADGMNIIYASIGFVVSIAASFIITLIIYKDDVIVAAKTPTEVINDKTNIATEELLSPLAGELIPLTQVNDEVFSGGILGNGMAVIPSVGELYAPADGTIINVFDTKHAISMETSKGAELLMHVGINTVKLNGEGFTAYVKDGDEVKKGQLLLKFDINKIKEAGYEITTPIIVTNTDDYKIIEADCGTVTTSSKIITLEV